ncbi:hypothetical protein EAE99_000057 [Botrytis elliptica]|nr:hypothetical protein EAE99_000057 [Botrytis elliptica]
MDFGVTTSDSGCGRTSRFRGRWREGRKEGRSDGSIRFDSMGRCFFDALFVCLVCSLVGGSGNGNGDGDGDGDGIEGRGHGVYDLGV